MGLNQVVGRVHGRSRVSLLSLSLQPEVKTVI
jgi:hypothetical protein